MVLSPLDVFWIVSAGLFGLVVGSFLNVCIYRMPRECMSLVRPGSRCVRCRRPVRWYDNVPVFSWLWLRGKCRHCRIPISARYPLVELLTGGLFAYTAYTQVARLDLWAGAEERIILFVVHAYLVANLVVSTFIDFDHKIIPDEITLAGTLLAPLASAAFPFLHGPELTEAIPNPHLASLAAGMVGMCIGGGIVYAFGVLGQLVFRKEAMGLGDVKLMAMIGGFLGWKAVILVFLFACVVGSLFGLLILIRTGNRYVAFGPYLSLGAIVMIFFAQPVMHFVLVTWPGMVSGPGGGGG